MKAFYIPMGLLLVILGFSLWTGRYVEQHTERWNAMLEEIEDLVRNEAWAEAEVRLETAYADWDASRAYEDWDSSQTFFHTIMDHSELDEAENLFAGAFAVCRERDSADFHMLLAQLAGQLRLLSETQCVSIKNIL